jgi:hypothetical protein
MGEDKGKEGKNLPNHTNVETLPECRDVAGNVSTGFLFIVWCG